MRSVIKKLFTRSDQRFTLDNLNDKQLDHLDAVGFSNSVEPQFLHTGGPGTYFVLSVDNAQRMKEQFEDEFQSLSENMQALLSKTGTPVNPVDPDQVKTFHLKGEGDFVGVIYPNLGEWCDTSSVDAAFVTATAALQVGLQDAVNQEDFANTVKSALDRADSERIQAAMRRNAPPDQRNDHS